VTRDWVQWHRAYDDPSSPLSQRRSAVGRLIRSALDAAAPGPITVVSLCAGDGRDLALGAADHPRVADLSGTLVELDPRLAADATVAMAGLRATIRVEVADAGDPDRFRHALPADLLLLCGIFGNISDDDIRRTIAAVPAMCRTGATVIWTRHRREPDLTPSIRAWFDAAGCESTGFVSPASGSFAIGCERVTVSSTAPMPTRLFGFLDDLW
jgi:hypothetical protein